MPVPRPAPPDSRPHGPRCPCMHVARIRTRAYMRAYMRTLAPCSFLAYFVAVAGLSRAVACCCPPGVSDGVMAAEITPAYTRTTTGPQRCSCVGVLSEWYTGNGQEQGGARGF